MWLGAVSHIDQLTADSELQLGAGDLLVLYSDGIIEAMNADHEMYGVERIVSKLTQIAEQPAASICEAILADVRAHTPIQADDRTLVVLRRLERDA
jgi:sigma-B regulation protein RsbU (phosphoserine phosphatase)